MSLNEVSAADNDEQILKMYHSIQTDRSTEDVCDMITEHMEKISERSVG